MPRVPPLSSSRPGVVSAPAFTLIELLTVIAIIGVLAAILIPVVGRVRQSARTAHCTKNLHGVGAAFHLYAADNKGLFPALRWRSQDAASLPASLLNPSEKGWQIEIGPYLAREVKTFSGLKAETDTYAFCPEYVSLYRNHPGWGQHNTGGYGMNVKTGASNWSLRSRPAQIRNPSKTILVGDSVDYFIDIGTGWKLDAGDADGKPGSYTNGDPIRHSGKAAYLFHDGHVSLLSPEESAALLAEPL